MTPPVHRTETDEMRTSLIIAYVLTVALAQARMKPLRDLIERKDQCCGPCCLSAFTRLTNDEERAYATIQVIYDLIGKDVNVPTSLYDLKSAAQKLGLRAEGFQCTLDDLRRMNGYAIVPIGPAKGTVTEPFHFILVRGVQEQEVLVVDPRTLQTRPVRGADLEDVWNGVALVLSTGGSRFFSPKRAPEPKRMLASSPEADEQTRDFGLVDAGSALKHSFPIRNETRDPVTLRIVSKSCSCVFAEMGSTTLLPGQETTLSLQLHVDKPGLSAARVVVEQRPGAVIRRYAIKAYGKDSFLTVPPIGYMEVLASDAPDYPVRIIYYADPNDSVTFSRMESDIQGLGIARIVPERIDEGTYAVFQFDLLLHLNTGDPRDEAHRVEGRVHFLLESLKGERSIPFDLIAGIGQRRFQLTPERLFLIVSRRAGSFSGRIGLKFLADPYPTSIKVEADETLPVVVSVQQASSDTFTITVSAQGNRLAHAANGMNEGRLRIASDLATHLPPIIVPVSIFVRE
jgi:predicted double-glycine peptidase